MFVGGQTVALPAEKNLADAFGRDIAAAGIDGFVDSGGDPGPSTVQLGVAAFAGGKIEALGQLFQNLALGAGGIAAVRIGKTA